MPAGDDSTVSCLSIRIPYRVFNVELDMQSEKPVSSFIAATLRGGFGYTLKRMVCSFNDEKRSCCAGCILESNCAYPFLFETSPPDDAPRLRKYQSVPRPFALRPRQTGSTMVIELLLLGSAVGMLPYVIVSLNELGKCGLGKQGMKFTIEKITGEDGAVVYPAGSGKTGCLPVAPHVLELIPGGSRKGSVEIEFISPLIIRKDTRALGSFEPAVFFATLLRRITNVNALYGQHPSLPIDPVPWLAAAKSVSVEAAMNRVTQKRFSTRQQTSIDYSGITGTVKLEGDIGMLLPLLEAGEILGVGKNTVFGYGVYRCSATTFHL